MAFVQLDFMSKCLNMHTAVNLALPEVSSEKPFEALPTLFLLHDMGEDMTAWQRFSPVERYAQAHGIAIVMPDGALSFYENMRHGAAYADYIALELPHLMRNYLPLSAQREKNFIAGFGMGGRGALKLGAAHPENYAAAGAFCASHFEIAPQSEAEKTALFRAYGDDTALCRKQIEGGVCEIARNERQFLIYHACTQADIAPETHAANSFFEKIGGKIDYRFQLYHGGSIWEMREKMLASFLCALKLSASEAIK